MDSMTLTCWLAGLAGLGLGLFLGYVGNELLEAIPLREHIVRMKKQGFVPQFPIDHEPEEDPTRRVRER